MANALATVQETYLSLDKQYNLLLAACRTQADRDALGTRYANAQLAYQQCVGKTLEDDDAAVSALNLQLIAVNKQVDVLTTQMGDMSKVFAVLDEALQLGQKLLACVP